MFGRPPPLIPRLGEEEMARLATHNLLKSLQALHKAARSARELVKAAYEETAGADAAAGRKGNLFAPGRLGLGEEAPAQRT